MQEFAFATKVAIHCDPVAFPWDDLLSVRMDYFYQSKVKDLPFDDGYTIREGSGRIVHDQREMTETNAVFLARCLSRFQTTDARDKIFGIRSLLRLCRVETLSPDYTKTVADIYEDFVLALIKATRRLHFNYYWDPQVDTQSLPSWVPDWTKVHDSGFERNVRQREGDEGPFKASEDSTISVIRMQSKRQLLITAFVLGTVEAADKSYSPPENTNLADPAVCDVLESWKGIALYSTQSQARHVSSSETLQNLQNLARTLFGDIFGGGLFGPRSKFNVPAFQEWLRNDRPRDPDNIGDLLDTPGDNLSRIMQDGYGFTAEDALLLGIQTDERYMPQRNFHYEVEPCWRNQKVFRTQSGLLGMAYRTAKPEDVVILAMGCRVPLIIRPSGRAYNYVCPAYVPGAIYGEMWPSSLMEMVYCKDCGNSRWCDEWIFKSFGHGLNAFQRCRLLVWRGEIGD